MQGPRTMPTAHRVIQGIEAVHMIRKAQLLGSQRTNPGVIALRAMQLWEVAASLEFLQAQPVRHRAILNLLGCAQTPRTTK